MDVFIPYISHHLKHSQLMFIEILPNLLKPLIFLYHLKHALATPRLEDANVKRVSRLTF